MIEIIGKKYLSEKEAANRYGYSRSWFAHKRLGGDGPKCVQLQKPSRVLYPLEETDVWFLERMKIRE